MSLAAIDRVKASSLKWCFMFLVTLPSTGQAQKPAPLSSQQQVAIDSITKAKLQGTVSFLASDEMQGRMTPSPELAIASRYVATRLRAAGLQPLAEDDSYFQVQTWPQITLPASAKLSVAGKRVKVLGVLAAGPDDVTLQGPLLSEVDALKATTTEDSKQALCVVLDGLPLPPIGQVSPGMLQSFLARRLVPLKRKGAALIIVKCDSSSSLPELANTLQGIAMSAMEGRNADLPVLLVAAADVAEGATVEAEVPAALDSTASVRNVFGIVKGSDPQLSKTAIIVTAHLDHIGTRHFGPDRINNGADDNATGVAAVLAMAEAVAAMPEGPKRSIIFGTFWGEESGLLGSKAYAKDPLWPLDQTVANVNFEMLGRPESDAQGKAWMTGWKHSNLGEIMNQGSLRAGVEIFNRTDVGEMLYTRSDNYSFVQKGVIAHSFSAGSLHSDYHQPTDEWEKLDFDHMTKVSKGLLSGLLHLANQTESPEKR